MSETRTLECLTPEQHDFYEREGYLLLESRIPQNIISQCRAEIERFTAEARDLLQSNERLDLESSHTPERPRLRRIKLPHSLSPVFAELMRSDLILAPVRDLIGPNLRLHTSKLNIKAASFGSPVDWHQDFAFYPHTNDDLLAVGVMLHDMSLENGPLTVYPGTHLGPIFDHHSGGVFAGTVDLQACGLDASEAVKLTAPAGSMSLHHARLVHGSDANRAQRDRSILFYEITCADAYPIMGAMTQLPSLEEFDRRLLCGNGTLEPRLEPVPVRIPLPQPSTQGSIYEIQKASATRGFGEGW